MVVVLLLLMLMMITMMMMMSMTMMMTTSSSTTAMTEEFNISSDQLEAVIPCNDNVFNVVFASSICANASAPSDRIKLFEIFYKKNTAYVNTTSAKDNYWSYKSSIFS